MSNKAALLFFTVMILLPRYAYPRPGPPRISGNIESGSRYALPYEEFGVPFPWTEYAADFEQESWAYNYHQGHVQVSQTVNSRFRYAARFNWISRDYPYADLNNRNVMRYYRSYCWLNLHRNLALRVEYYLRQQVYEWRPWDNLTHVPNIQIRWDIDRERRRRANLFLRLNSRRFLDAGETWKDRDQLSARVNFQEEVFERLILKAQYSYNFRHYTDNPDQTTAVKKALSAGFEYQF